MSRPFGATTCFFKKDVGIGSSSHVEFLAAVVIFLISSSVVWRKSWRILKLIFGLSIRKLLQFNNALHTHFEQEFHTIS